MSRTNDGYVRTLFFICLLTGAFLGLWPQLDLAVSRFFYAPGQGFQLSGSTASELFRASVWDLSMLVFLVTLLGIAIAPSKRRLWRVPSGLWIYLFALYVLGPLVLVNGILKAHWGRARPADVVEFGGEHQFTPFWQPADECLKNCSFVSGEVAAVFALSLAMLMLTSTETRSLRGPWRHIFRVLAFALPPLVMLQRLAAGRHFLSDVVLAGLIVLLLAGALTPLLAIGRRATD